MTESAPPVERPEPAPRPRLGWRLALNLVLAAMCLIVAFSRSLESSCSTDAACRLFDVVTPLVAFGPFVTMLVAAVLWGFLVDRSSRAAWPANLSLAFTVLMLFALPVLDPFRDGWAGRTGEGRARIHAAARQRIVAIVDETVRAVLPHATPRPEHTPGTRDTTGDDICEREVYSVEARVPAEHVEALARAVADHWRARGYEVHGPGWNAAFVGARSGRLRFSFSGDEHQGRAEFFGGGPCLRVG